VNPGETKKSFPGQQEEQKGKEEYYNTKFAQANKLF
jgi:hypothetical protein